MSRTLLNWALASMVFGLLIGLFQLTFDEPTGRQRLTALFIVVVNVINIAMLLYLWRRS